MARWDRKDERDDLGEAYWWAVRSPHICGGCSAPRSGATQGTRRLRDAPRAPHRIAMGEAVTPRDAGALEFLAGELVAHRVVLPKPRTGYPALRYKGSIPAAFHSLRSGR
jgi:hypothetical protein